MSYRTILIFLLCCFSFFSCDTQPSEKVSIVISPSREYQTIKGFGASDAWRCQFVGEFWPEDKKEAIADLLFSQETDKNGNPLGIGLSLWRFYIGSGSARLGNESQIVNDWRRAECYQNADGSYDWEKQKGQKWFMEAAKKRGVEKYLAFSIAPPVHMSKNKKGHAEKGDISINIQEGKLNDYANFLTDVLYRFEKDGLPFDYLSPFNEPQWNWDNHTQEGTPATNSDLRDFIISLSEQLSMKDLNTRLLIGEAATINHLSGFVENDNRDNQIEYFFGENSPDKLPNINNLEYAVSAHSYFTTWPIDTLIATRKRLQKKILETNPDLAYWQTEFCILEKNSEITGGKNRDLSMATALYVLRVIHADLVLNNAESWQWWTALSQCDYKDGLVYLDDEKSSGMVHPKDPVNDSLKYDGFYRDSKLLWAFGNYSRFIRPGAVRIGVDIPNDQPVKEQLSDLMVSAWLSHDKNSIVLVIINPDPENKRIALYNKNKNNKLGRKTVTAYVTAENRNLHRQVYNTKKIRLEPLSATTLILPLNYFN